MLKWNRQSFSRIRIQLDTVAEHPPSTILPRALCRSLRLPNYFRGDDFVPTTFARVYIPGRTFDRAA